MSQFRGETGEGKLGKLGTHPIFYTSYLVYSPHLSGSHSRPAHLDLTTPVRPTKGSNHFVAASSGVLHWRALWAVRAGPARKKCPGNPGTQDSFLIAIPNGAWWPRFQMWVLAWVTARSASRLSRQHPLIEGVCRGADVDGRTVAGSFSIHDYASILPCLDGRIIIHPYGSLSSVFCPSLLRGLRVSVVKWQFPVPGEQGPLRPAACRLQSPAGAGQALRGKFLRSLRILRSTEGRREASYYGEII